MRFLLRHPVVTGVSFEVLLVVSGMYFAMPEHRRLDIVAAVDSIHYPASTFIAGMADLLEFQILPVQLQVLSSTFTAPVWVVLLYIIGGIVDPRLGATPRKASRRVRLEAEEEPCNLQRKPPHDPPLVSTNTRDNHPCPSNTGGDGPRFPWLHT